MIFLAGLYFWWWRFITLYLERQGDGSVDERQEYLRFMCRRNNEQRFVPLKERHEPTSVSWSLTPSGHPRDDPSPPGPRKRIQCTQ